MKTATVEIIADGRPINVPDGDRVEGTNVATIAARALRAAKPKIRRGTTRYQLRITIIKH